MHRCSITEIEAINILNGNHGMDYIRKYELRRGEIEDIFVDEKTLEQKRGYLKWLAEQEEAERLKKIRDMLDGG